MVVHRPIMSGGNTGEHALGSIAVRSTKPAPFGLARRYKAAVRVETVVHNIPRSNLQTIIYEILARNTVVPPPSLVAIVQDKKTRAMIEKDRIAFEADQAKTLQGYLVNTQANSCYLTTPEEYKKRLVSIKFKFSHTPAWECFDMDGMVHALTSYLAFCTLHPEAKYSTLQDAGEVKLYGMNNPDETYAVSESRVFISRGVSPTDHAATFWALVWAAAACKSVVLTEHVVLSSTFSPLLQDFGGATAWHGAIEALAILAELYETSGNADTFALPFFSGIHKVLTVVGHSDEGGVTRDALRLLEYGPSYGGLPSQCPRSMGMPSIAQRGDFGGLQAWVDSMALLSAAAVAHCDPLCVLGNGDYYSTVVDSGGVPEGKDRIKSIGSAITQSWGQFSQYYCTALAKLLGLYNMSGQRHASAALCMAGDQLFSGGSSRHLDHDVVAPYFWVEPTTLLFSHQFGTPAERHGLASYGAKAEEVVLPFFDQAERQGVDVGCVSDWTVMFSSARRCGALLYLNNNIHDGLGHITIRQADPDNICLSGLHNEDERTAMLRGATLNEYLWKRGQSKLPHPAELSNLGKALTFRVSHYDIMGDTPVPYRNIPHADQLESTTIKLIFQKACEITPNKPNAEDIEVRRQRKLATSALSRAAEMMGAGVGKQYSFMPLVFTVPAHSSLGVQRREVDTNRGEGALAQRLGGEYSTSLQTAQVGSLVAPTIHHEALRGPQLPRSAAPPPTRSGVIASEGEVGGGGDSFSSPVGQTGTESGGLASGSGVHASGQQDQTVAAPGAV